MYSAMAAGPTVPVTAYSQTRNRGQSSFHRSLGDGSGAAGSDVDAAGEGAAAAGSLALADRGASSTSGDKRMEGWARSRTPYVEDLRDRLVDRRRTCSRSSSKGHSARDDRPCV